ncbi:inter-alpha-trypsin inhibitor heavy chain h1 [Lasius niger]|uniref:Inter-alpha-trypsin inhibitor heavy chain h1 n=1 Tax=Lasius niger TaxID=67767 RepID=A0A0J7KL62_LASNI|nr:inter-alpha-trypsin inhibitor heavy chain h1 [Lasius niger]
MWKKMEKISDKNEIDKLALELLGPRMPKLRDELIKFVPSPTNPTDQENETQWLLNIDLKQTHEHFLLFEDQMDSLLLEDKIDNSAYLQCIQAINIGQNSQVI